MDCWICGQLGDSGEHLMKASDLKADFGSVSQNQPLYVHSNLSRNVKTNSVKNKIFKSTALICARCNNSLSQPYDLAWEALSTALRDGSTLRAGQFIKLNKIFLSPRDSMLNVHLYFVKLFGCHIAANKIPIDIQSFANALGQRKSHPRVFIAIGPSPFIQNDAKISGWSEIRGLQFSEGNCTYANWFYHTGNVAVLVTYAEEGEARYGRSQSWHPDSQGRLLRAADFG